MNHKITRKTSNEEIDQLLKSKYMEEVELIESSLCKTQENMPIIKPYKESEEKIKEGYDKLVASLKRKEQYRYEISYAEREKWEKIHNKIKIICNCRFIWFIWHNWIIFSICFYCSPYRYASFFS